jgi:hypothetical protein
LCSVYLIITKVLQKAPEEDPVQGRNIFCKKCEKIFCAQDIGGCVCKKTFSRLF